MPSVSGSVSGSVAGSISAGVEAGLLETGSVAVEPEFVQAVIQSSKQSSAIVDAIFFIVCPSFLYIATGTKSEWFLHFAS